MDLSSDSVEGPTLRTQRLRLAWLLAVPFLLFAEPTPLLFVCGAPVSALGLLLRAWAAGSIRKDQELAMEGPYGRVRHPLYLGTFLLGSGLVVTAGKWWFSLPYLAIFVWLYGRTIKQEDRGLQLLFREAHEVYRRRVPAFVPRFGADGPAVSGAGFRIGLYRRNKEWQAAIGAGLGFGLLWVRMACLGP